MPLTPKRLFDTPTTVRSYKKQRTIPVTKRPLVPEVKELLLPFNIAQVNNGAGSFTVATDIVQGTAANNRLGNRVKLLSIEVTGKMDFGSLLLVCPKNSFIAPSLANFSNGLVPFYDADQGWTVLAWSPDVNNQICDYGRLRKRFPNGMDVQWDGVSACKNHIYLCIINRTGVNLTNISGNIRLRYVDA
jgi:hypothetical protein